MQAISDLELWKRQEEGIARRTKEAAESDAAVQRKLGDLYNAVRQDPQCADRHEGGFGTERFEELVQRYGLDNEGVHSFAHTVDMFCEFAAKQSKFFEFRNLNHGTREYARIDLHWKMTHPK